MKSLKTNISEERDDLFIEQYVIPKIMFIFEESFKFLKTKDLIRELQQWITYGSGEIADMILRASKIGIHQIWQKEASPTCRFGLMNSLNNFVKTRNKEINTMNMVLKI